MQIKKLTFTPIMDRNQIKNISTNIVSDIRFWILLYFTIQLFSVTHPILEGSQGWRQSTGIMIYRNFYETDANILYPRLDMAGEKTGITGTEFPIHSYLSYLLAQIFGYHGWFGRLINMIISGFGIYYFYRTIALYFNKRHAFLSAFLLLNSIWFMFSRKSMPDTFSLSLAFISIYNGIRYLKGGKFYHIITYLVFGSLGVLSKIPAILPFAILLFPFLSKEVTTQRKIPFGVASTIILASVGIWYLYWVPYLNATYQFSHYYMGISMSIGFKELVQHWQETLNMFYFNSFCGFLGFVFYIGGAVMIIKDKKKDLILPFIILSIGMLLFMGKSGYNFSKHSYYILPFTTIMAWIGGYFLDKIKIKWLFLTLIIAFTIESISNQQHELFLRKGETYKLEFEKVVNSISKKEDLFATNGESNPQHLYFLHRKGWTFNNAELSTQPIISDIISKGCKFIFINKKMGDIKSSFPVIYEDKFAKVYDLRQSN